MANAFLKQYELVIGSPDHSIEIKPKDPLITKTGWLNFSLDFPVKSFHTVPAGIRALTISELQIKADIKYSLEESSSNKQDATLRIYNLTKENQKFIRKNGTIHLKAGYINPVNVIRDSQLDTGERRKETERVALPLVFVGQILKAHTERVGADMITTLLCSDSKLPLEEAKISRTYKGTAKKPLTYLDVISDLINELAKKGVPKGYISEDIDEGISKTPVGTILGIKGLTPNKVEVSGLMPVLLNEITPLGEKLFNSSYIVEGSISETLTNICNNIGYRFYICLGRSYVEPKSGPKRPAVAFVRITQEHIKNNIKVDSDSENLTEGSSDAKDGIIVDLFLNGLVSLEKRISVSGTLQDGLYKITTVQHKLDYEGNDWTTSVTAKAGE